MTVIGVKRFESRKNIQIGQTYKFPLPPKIVVLKQIAPKNMLIQFAILNFYFLEIDSYFTIAVKPLLFKFNRKVTVIIKSRLIS